MKFFIQWLVIFTLLVSATAGAQQVPSSASPAARAQTTFSNNDVSFRYLENSTQAIRRDSQGREFILDMPVSSGADLKKFSPSTMIEQFKAAAKKTHPIKAFQESYQHFPRESFLFFVAIGAVTMFQLATDSSSNPMRMQEHLEHSISPLGMFSFFTFMYANKVSTSFLDGWLKNPRFRGFIPYMGMTAGFFVQTTISAFAADPEVKSCVSQLLGKSPAKDAKACDGAYARYVFKKQLSLAAPGLISMMASTVIAGLLQKGLEIGVYKLTGVDIALWFIPGGVGISLVRFAIASTTQMAVFYYLDAGWLNRKVTFAWRNIIDGRSLGKLEREIVDDIATQKSKQWSEPRLSPLLCQMSGQEKCDRNLGATLKTFNQEATEWRTLNLIETHEAHQAWQTKLSQISGEYNVSHAFYRDFAVEVRNSRFELEPLPMRRLDLAAPLMGVPAKDVNPEKMSELYRRPSFYEENARLTAVDVGQWLSSKLAVTPVTNDDLKFLASIAARLKTGDEKQIRAANQELYNGLRAEIAANTVSSRNSIVIAIRRKLRGLDSDKPDASHSMTENGKAVGLWLQDQLDSGALTNRDAQMLLPRDQKLLNDLAEKLKSGNAQIQGQAILDLNKTIEADMAAPDFKDRTAFLTAVRMKLGGNPTPYFEKGRGFLAAFETFSDNAQLVKNTAFSSSNGVFKTPRATDHMVMQMLCGPDAEKGEAMVSSSLGFAATFHAPRLVEGESSDLLCGGGVGGRPVNEMYRTEIVNEKGRSFTGILDYLKGNARPSAIGDQSKSNFDTWWSFKVEAQIKAAYEDYGVKYSEIIAKMITSLQSDVDSSWNAGPLANGPITSMRQQMRFNLMIMGEMLKDLYKAQKKQNLPVQYFSSVLEPTPIAQRADGNESRTGMLAALRHGGYTKSTSEILVPETILEWNQLIRSYDNPYAKSAEPVIGRALQAQKEVEFQFEQLIWMIRQIKVQSFDVSRKERVGRATTTKKYSENRIVSELENNEIQDQVKKIGDELSKFGTLLGVEIDPTQKNLIGPGDDKKSGLVTLTTDQQEVVKTALEGLQGLANELGMLGIMSNSVSWDKINELKKAKAQAAALNSQINSAEAELGALLEKHESSLDQANEITEE